MRQVCEFGFDDKFRAIAARHALAAARAARDAASEAEREALARFDASRVPYERAEAAIAAVGAAVRDARALGIDVPLHAPLVNPHRDAHDRAVAEVTRRLCETERAQETVRAAEALVARAC